MFCLKIDNNGEMDRSLKTNLMFGSSGLIDSKHTVNFFFGANDSSLSVCFACLPF